MQSKGLRHETGGRRHFNSPTGAWTRAGSWPAPGVGAVILEQESATGPGIARSGVAASTLIGHRLANR